MQDEMQGFVERVDAMPMNERAVQHQKAKDMFDFAEQELKKMFQRWYDTRLMFLSAFGEYETGKLVARYLISSTVITSENAAWLIRPSENTTFKSKQHGCTIDLRKVCQFIVQCVDQNSLLNFRQTYHYVENRGLFELIANGTNVWDRSLATQEPRRKILIRYGALPSNTQMAERGNKSHNLCASNNRGDIATMVRNQCRSITNEVASVTAIGKKRKATSGRAHKKSVFGHVQSFVALELACRRRKGKNKTTDWFAYIKTRMFDKKETMNEKEFEGKKALIDLTAKSTRVPYACELRTGYDASPYQDREVQFGKLKREHAAAMQAELDAREIPYAPEDVGKIKTLGNILKRKLRNNWIAQNPGVDVKIYDEDERLTKFFKPMTDISNFAYNVVQ